LPPQVFLFVSRGSERYWTIIRLIAVFEKKARGHTFALGYKLFVFGVGGREYKEERRRKGVGLLICLVYGRREGRSTMSLLIEDFICRREAERTDTQRDVDPVAFELFLGVSIEKEIIGSRFPGFLRKWRVRHGWISRQFMDIKSSEEAHILAFTRRFGFEVEDRREMKVSRSVYIY
jgi:hypothetical protein